MPIDLELIQSKVMERVIQYLEDMGLGINKEEWAKHFESALNHYHEYIQEASKINKITEID